MIDPVREAALTAIAGEARRDHAELLAAAQGWRLVRFLDVLEGRSRPDPTPPSRRLHRRMFMPGLEPRPYWPAERFPVTQLLRARLPLIREEAGALLASAHAFHIPPGEAHLGDGAIDGGRLYGAWNAWYLQRHFGRQPLAAAFTPVTLRSLDGCQVSREALMSVVGPGAHIATHSDELNFVTTLYLPIICPPGAWIEFDGLRREWREGELFAADSTFLHQSYNPTSHWRVILIVDLWHPDLTADEIAVLTQIMPRIDAVMRGEARRATPGQTAPAQSAAAGGPSPIAHLAVAAPTALPAPSRPLAALA